MLLTWGVHWRIFLLAMGSMLNYSIYALAIIFLIGSLDDAFIDLVYWIKGLRIRPLSQATARRWNHLAERSIAIMIPAWKEASVLSAMVRVNRSRIKYSNYRFFIGVYPNDAETMQIAKELEAQNPGFVSVIITDRPGPTSKAHCLNCILAVLDKLSAIAEQEKAGWLPDLIAIHDAEDVIHPLALKAINAEATGFHFLQIPIFSLPVKAKQWVAGTYLDEFSEIHTKELPARTALQMPVPSAGVGTFFDWNYFRQMGQRLGYWFDEKNLTEDYEISYRMARLGARQKFVLVRDADGEIIATREYFPSELGRSIRQKTRWTTGIALQTWEKWRWFGLFSSASLWKRMDFAMFYALWRDRKSLWSNPLSLASWVFVLFAVSYLSIYPMEAAPKGLLVLLYVNMALLVLRCLQRVYFTGAIYGLSHGLLSIPRYFLGIFINGSAAMFAIRDYIRANLSSNNQEIRWDKTEHTFPEYLIQKNNKLPVNETFQEMK